MNNATIIVTLLDKSFAILCSNLELTIYVKMIMNNSCFVAELGRCEPES